MRWRIATWLTIQATELSGFILKNRAWPYALSDYKHLPKNSLGYHYYTCISEHKIDYKPNLVKHDMKHIILGYDMSIQNELNIVAFLIGNNSYNKFGVIYLLVCLLIVPEHSIKLIKHYKRGKTAKCLKNYQIELFVEADIKKTRKLLNIN